MELRFVRRYSDSDSSKVVRILQYRHQYALGNWSPWMDVPEVSDV